MYAIHAYIRVVLGVNVGIYGIHGVFGISLHLRITQTPCLEMSGIYATPCIDPNMQVKTPYVECSGKLLLRQ